ncbi:uncharacterized protein DDB_G0271670-like [Musca vetustissima]|uniref:uncharacterized protein DDB_G0271670-like n=1 Tax=Musca vetustissima TaxID=27455 RepID=UPI002AB5F6A8|nr:uncharacterized protein DDB_G0271670-like [Musca vetustissima]
MATKTIINCMDQTTTSSPVQGISIKIDQTASPTTTTGIIIPNYSGPASAALVSNVIKIQHSCQTSDNNLKSSSSSSSSSTPLNGQNDNKLLIDINRKQTTTTSSTTINGGDCAASSFHVPTSSTSSSAVIQVKCTTPPSMAAVDLPLSSRQENLLESNGIGKTREQSNNDHVLRESCIEVGKESSQQRSNNFNESNQMAITTTTTTTTIHQEPLQQQQLTSQQLKPDQLPQPVVEWPRKPRQ